MAIIVNSATCELGGAMFVRFCLRQRFCSTLGQSNGPASRCSQQYIPIDLALHTIMHTLGSSRLRDNMEIISQLGITPLGMCAGRLDAMCDDEEALKCR